MNENQINEITQQVDGGITPTEVEYDEFAGTSVYGTESSTALDGGQEEIIETEVEEVEQTPGVEMIEGEPMTDATDSGTEMNHALLYNREAENQHPIGAITGLSDRLKAIEAVKRAYAKGSSFAEFKQWNDSNPSAENRAGYFVYIVPNSDTIEICGESNEVYGVTTSDAAFVGNQVAADRSDDWTYSMVSLIGTAKVRVDATVRTGDYVVPNAYGEATLSENNYGYKVLSMGSYPEYNYAVIALVPQSSTLNKILGSLSGGEFDLGNILLEIEDIRGTANNAANNAQIAIDTSKMTEEEIGDILTELDSQQQQITNVETVLEETQTQAEEAETTAQAAQSSAASAYQAAQAAKEEAVASANHALSEVSTLKEDIKPLAEWSDPETGASGIVGFVAQADSDHTLLASIAAGSDDTGSDLTAIRQTKDMIQHLVSHMDRYAVGEHSLSYGLSLEEADAVLTETYVYVSTADHTEEMDDTTLTFQRGYAYTWSPETDTWTESAEPVSTATEYVAGTAVGDLWYCWQSGITQTDDNGEVITTYEAGTLYRWYGSEWVAVATVADNYQSRITSSLKQTSDSMQSDIVALDGRVTTMRQDVDGITTLVGDSDGNSSTIIQRVGKIEYDVYNENGTVSSIQQQADDNSASITDINTGRFHIVYQSFLEAAPEAVGDKYSERPVWDDVTETFVFNDAYIDNTDGIYYFISEDQTKYCCVTDDGYDIYTIGNEATAMIHSRIDDAESRIDLLAEFDTQTSNTIAGLTARADANEAEIDLVASRYNHILLSVSTEEVVAVGYKYTTAPEWNSATGQYEFDATNRSDDGTYYMADDDNQTYCHVATAGDGSLLYETYGLSGSSVAALQQQVDENSASIGMVVDQDGVKGSAIVEAINGQSVATINADKIKLTGTDEITLAIKGATDKASNNVTLIASSQMFTKAADATDYEPSSITLIAYTSGTLTSYAWYRDDVEISDATSNNLTVLPSDISGNATTYKVVSTDGDGDTYSDVISIAKLADGKDGQDGSDGANGTSYYTWIKYADDADGTNMSDEPEGKAYIGLAHNKTDINESNVASDYQWSLIQGAAGTNGEDGTTYYTWVKYADDENGTGLTDDPTDKKYIGLAYNKDTDVESTNASDYTWALFRGQDGIDGQDGANGQDGKDGTTYYTWIKYADTPTSGMSDEPEGKVYMGIAYNQTSETESTDYDDYQWSLIKGTDGINGEDGTTYYTWVKYADDADGTNMSDDPTDKKYIGLAYNKDTNVESTDAADYTWALFRGADGVNGQDGQDGKDGEDGIDGYTIILSNEYVEIPVYASSKPKEPHTITSVVSVYKGTTKLTVTNTTPTENTFQIQSIDAPSYLTATSSGDTVTVNVEVDEPIADLSEVTLIIALDGGLTLTAVIKVRANMNNREAIVSLINQTDDTVTIRAENLDLMGYVTFSDLTTDTTTISGPNISCYNGQFSLRSGTADNYTEVITLDSNGSLVVNNKSSNVIINDDGLICYNSGFSLRSGTPDSYTEVMKFDTNWGFTLTGTICQSTSYGYFLLWDGVAQWVGSSTLGSLAYYPDVGGIQLSASDLLQITSNNTLTISATNAMKLSAATLDVPNVVRCYTDGMWSLASLTADGSANGILSITGSDVNLAGTKSLNLSCSYEIGTIALSSQGSIQLTATTGNCNVTCSYFNVTSTGDCALHFNGKIGFVNSSAPSYLGIIYTADGYTNGAYTLGTGCSLVIDSQQLFVKMNGTQYGLSFQNGYVMYFT